VRAAAIAERIAAAAERAARAEERRARAALRGRNRATMALILAAFSAIGFIAIFGLGWLRLIAWRLIMVISLGIKI
jgi:hypothetical protein